LEIADRSRMHSGLLVRSVGSRMHSGHNTRHSCAQLVFTCSWFSHAQRAQHTPLSGSVGSRDLACTAGTSHATPALTWFSYSRMHSGHNTRHSRAQLVFTCSWFSHAQRAQHTPLSGSVGSRDLACTAGTSHATPALTWFS